MGGSIAGTIGGVKVGDQFPPRIMGVINLTRNSFYSGSVQKEKNAIEAVAKAMEEAGASFIDVGARSTAPYRKYDVSVETEGKLLAQAVRSIAKVVEIPVSADTTHIEPARLAVSAGASILNDVYGMTQQDANSLAKLACSKECSVILTAHEVRAKKGSDPILRIHKALSGGLATLKREGVDEREISVDPGIGFFQDSSLTNVQWNCSVLKELSALRIFDKPICVGVSRKKFVGTLLGGKPAEGRLYGSLAAAAVSVFNGAHIIRTHDVAETADAIRVATAIRSKGF